MFRLIIQCFFVLFLSISIISTTSIISIGADDVTNPPSTIITTTDPLDRELDLSNNIIEGCSLKILDSPIGVGEVQKSQYVSECVQGILRFVIVLAVLAAVLKIAFSGLMSMAPVKVGGSENTATVVSNLVIGLFLLLVGWNLVPTLNASFNNQNYMNLPTYTLCQIKSEGKCINYDQFRTKTAEESLKKYATAKQTKKWDGSKFDNSYTINVMDAVCRARADDKAYKDIDKAFCKEDYRKFLESIAPKEVEATATSGKVDDSMFEKVPNYQTNNSRASGRGSINTNLPPLVVLHHTAGQRSSIDGNRNAIESPASGPSVQFGIKDDPNKVELFMDMTNKGQHAVGTWFTPGYQQFGVNSISFGIEIYYDPIKGEIPNDNQITATAKLVAYLEQKYKSGPDQMAFHGEIDPEYRNDEPWGLVFDTPAHQIASPLKMHPNFPKLISKIRSFGGFKSGNFASMDDNKLATYIFRRNAQNGLESSGREKYRVWLDNNK